jgi:hypothetical protein
MPIRVGYAKVSVYRIRKAIIETDSGGTVVGANKHGIKYFGEDITDVIRRVKGISKMGAHEETRLRVVRQVDERWTHYKGQNVLRQFKSYRG